MAEFPTLYTTKAINEDGIEGQAYIQDGLKVAVSSPLKSVPGTNPEQLIGLALSTCLNATLEAIEGEHQQAHQSSVVTTVKMSRDRFGYQFWVDAAVTIPEVDDETAAHWLAIAETRCPVAKLVGDSSNVTIHLA
ncbi:OsmC family protein [Lactiplantibacillus mudanjiangensis]|uniref:Dihydroneopterin aldolase [Lactobacillus paraplantarum] n=1 Tax=Lactiplantibacillus mudanjiangensis TaxID=1296538 RepID=A0A660E5D6_9LACO|nr:OsmC family protein [Lactiplantibacillus mudanjiangensis]VDG17843.1 dihydroneopterin aldolase [Lactobacillus paraplantarum] [Lactiplantibacillus mudanjiangensis]VDG23289.1 dihydroneopterin aldolase [Lactobacillus paraplantarum] [Lactiplantibacillus mudanjiangensis]VDG28250.1 dihydroneopterin aldolase [Lactobacillus paraplantarum] [Lactiplantibacillus mudanjiangensis]VDG32459.1 dihydroneopterin aldolase [Lactobacillus paraplantarum] [Lactiplantibacillus mudanjiangensis]